MHSLFSELRKLRDGGLAVIRSPAKMNALLHIPLYSNALYLALTNVVNVLLGFVFWIIAARLYSTEAVGLASALNSTAVLLENLSVLGLGYGLIRFLKSSSNPAKLINSIFTLTGLLSLGVTGIFIIGLGIWSPRLMIIRGNPYYLVIFLLFVPILLLDDSTDQVMMASRKAGFIVVHSLIFNTLRLTLLVLLAIFFQSFGIFSSLSAATFIALLISVFLLLPKVQPAYRLFLTVDSKAVSKILHFSFLNYLGDLFWTIPGFVLPIIVVNLLGTQKNAYFYIAWTLGSMLTMIPTAVATSLLAEGTYDEANLKNHIGRSFKMVAVVLVPAVALVWFLADKLLLLYGFLYAEKGAVLLRWLAIAAFPLAVNTVYFSIKRVQKNMKPVILMGSFMAIITILMSYLLLPRFGINGVGIAWLSAQSVIALVVIAWDMRRWMSG